MKSFNQVLYEILAEEATPQVRQYNEKEMQEMYKRYCAIYKAFKDNNIVVHGILERALNNALANNSFKAEWLAFNEYMDKANLDNHVEEYSRGKSAANELAYMLAWSSK